MRFKRVSRHLQAVVNVHRPHLPGPATGTGQEQRGGVGFWILCIVFSLGFYGLLWFMMALGSAAGY